MQSRLIPWIVDDFIGDNDATVADMAFELGTTKLLALAHRTEKVIANSVSACTTSLHVYVCMHL